MKFKKKLLLLFCTMTFTLCFTACAQFADPIVNKKSRDFGIVVQYSLASSSSNKKGVNASTESGKRIFGPSTLTQKNSGIISIDNGRYMSIPNWVRVTWREGVDEENGLYWTTGKIVGNYKVDVLNRIPLDAFKLIESTPDTSLKLKFRIKNDGVLFGWSVEQHVIGGYKDIKRGGDFID